MQSLSDRERAPGWKRKSTLSAEFVPGQDRNPVAFSRPMTGSMTRALHRTGRYPVIVATLVLGLAADAVSGLTGQFLISIAVWIVLLGLLAGENRDVRQAAFACLVIATAGEIFLSLVWGLYTYRLENIPLYVPPGHVLMLLLGMALARRMAESTALVILLAAGLYSIAMAFTGVDTFGIPLFLVLVVASWALPSQRRLYASTFLLAMTLELYGTWLGCWTWEQAVPGLGLTTTNPPGAAGAFYSALDALVASASYCLASRFQARPV